MLQRAVVSIIGDTWPTASRAATALLPQISVVRISSSAGRWPSRAHHVAGAAESKDMAARVTRLARACLMTPLSLWERAGVRADGAP